MQNKTCWEIADEIKAMTSEDETHEFYGTSMYEAWLGLLDYNTIPPKAEVLRVVNDFLKRLGYNKVVDYNEHESGEQYEWKFESTFDTFIPSENVGVGRLVIDTEEKRRTVLLIGRPGSERAGKLISIEIYDMDGKKLWEVNDFGWVVNNPRSY